jgi:hypothetical protein
MRGATSLLLFLLIAAVPPLPPGRGALAAQQIVDQVIVRVGERAIFETEVRAALALGVIEARGNGDPQAAALEAMIERQLMLTEIQRGTPPEPDPAAVDAEVERLKAWAGGELGAIMARNGVDDMRLRQMARDTLRIQLYLDTRFPQPTVSDAEAEAFYKMHPEAFRRNGVLMTFDQAAAAARAAAAQERRESRIAQWLTGLRKRADVRRPSVSR